MFLDYTVLISWPPVEARPFDNEAKENTMNDDVTQYINKAQPWQVDVCEKLRAMVGQTIPEVEERLQYGKPHYLKNGHYAAVIAVAKDKISFMVFTAADIPAVKGF